MLLLHNQEGLGKLRTAACVWQTGVADREGSEEEDEEEVDELAELGFNKKLTARTEKYRAQVAKKLREVRAVIGSNDACVCICQASYTSRHASHVYTSSPFA